MVAHPPQGDGEPDDSAEALGVGSRYSTRRGKARDPDADTIKSIKMTINKATLILARGHARRGRREAAKPWTHIAGLVAIIGLAVCWLDPRAVSALLGG
jgi:hypothetical protein